MPTWILAVIAASIAATAGLTWLLLRINYGPGGRPAASKNKGGDTAAIAAEGGAKSRLRESENDGNHGDGGSADGGGDGGGD